MSMSKPILISGLGDPVMDVLIRLSHEELAALGLEPGGCTPIDGDGINDLLETAGIAKDHLRIPGGSAANVLKGIANISNGAACCTFMGMVGVDATGTEYRAKLAEQRVQPLLLASTSDQPSAVSVCLVTPDGQRTMRTHLGASLGLSNASQLPADWAKGCRLLHCEGYCLYRPQLAREMMTLAKAAGATVSIDFASFELVRNCHATFMSLLESGLVDLVFANEEEALELNRVLESSGSPMPTSEVGVAAAQERLLAHCSVAVVSLGPRGCVARTKEGIHASSPAGGVKVVDTIGAGDCFTAGFLVAHLGGGDLEQCCAAGCAAGSEAVQATGAELSKAAVRRLQTKVASILGSVSAAAAAAAAVAGGLGDAAVSAARVIRDREVQVSAGLGAVMAELVLV